MAKLSEEGGRRGILGEELKRKTEKGAVWRAVPSFVSNSVSSSYGNENH